MNPEHAEDLARFGIPPDVLEAAHIQSVTDAQAREILGLHGHHGADLGGILYPYISPISGRRNGGRIRLDHPLSEGGKYISEPGRGHLFFPPDVAQLLQDVSVPIVIVEAEKSALALTAFATRMGKKYLVFALGGCYGWRRTIGRRPLPDGGSEQETGPAPDLDLINWQRRRVILVFDSNASTNSNVHRARRALAQELTARGAAVLIGEVPAIEGVNGPDDLIAISGDEAMVSALDKARLFAGSALAEAEQALSELEAGKNIPPLPVIETVAEIQDSAHRALLIGRLAALRIPGVNRKFIEQQLTDRWAEEEADRRKTAEVRRTRRLMAMDISGAALLNEICAFVRRFIILSETQLRVLALWVVHTYVFAAADSTPYLSATSPEKRSGKTRCLEVCETIVAKPWRTAKASAAVLYRKIHAESPTVLLDESDATFNIVNEHSEALRGILNSGHGRGGKVTCCVGKGADISYQDFSTFSPKMIAGIGKLPDTVADRSIPIRLQRKTRDEKVERFRSRDASSEAAGLRERLDAWAVQNIERLRGARPELPEELSDRQQDGAEPLLAIADLAGGEWPEAARRALVSLFCGGPPADDSTGTLLLSDIRQIFVARETNRLSSTELSSALAEIETSPWGEWNRGKPITPRKLAQLLRAFDVNPHNIRTEKGVFKGYEAGDFEQVWARYLSSPVAPSCPETATPLHRYKPTLMRIAAVLKPVHTALT